jgi:hypothetical protein
MVGRTTVLSFGRRGLAAALVAVVTIVLGGAAFAAVCEEPDNGSGTVNLPPTDASCADGYVSKEPFKIIAGLPPGTTIELDVKHDGFVNIVSSPGGTLGGEREVFDSWLRLTVSGTGDLASFNRSISVPALGTETHSAPRTPGDAVQNFDRKLYHLYAEQFGDPDFCVLRISIGSSLSLADSPGYTSLNRRGSPGSAFNVDSFFDVTYQIEFQGCPGSQLEGFSGITVAGATAGADPVRIELGEPLMDHMKCWKVKDLKNPRFEKIKDPGVSLHDQFGDEDDVDVIKPFFVCNPADKNGSGIRDENAHLCCYKIKAQKVLPRPQIEITDQFGTVQLEAIKPQILCQPCSKTELP